MPTARENRADIREGAQLRVLLIQLCLLWLACVWVGAQPEDGPIRVEVVSVPIDVSVIGKDGRPIVDLDADDFEVFENGEKQTITHFQRVSFSRGNSVRREPRANEQSSNDAVTQHRTFVILFCRGINTGFRSIEQLIEFLETSLLPNDRLAVVAYNRATPVTRNHEAIIQIVRKYKESNRDIDQKLTVEGRYFRPKRVTDQMSRHIQGKIDALFATEELGSKTFPPSAAMSGAAGARLLLNDDPAARDGLGSTSPFLNSPGRLPVEYRADLFGEYVERSLRTGWDVSNIFSALEYLRLMPGEKHLLVFSREGLFLPDLSWEGEEALGRFASDARVRIHFIHTGGVVEAPRIDFDLEADRSHWNYGNDDRLRSLGFGRENQTFAQRALSNVSALSGGRGFLMTDTLEALHQVETMTREVYLLAYQPDPEKQVQGFREISLAVRRDNAQVFHRQGYFGQGFTGLPDFENYLGYTRIVSAAISPQDVDDFAMALKVSKFEAKEDLAELTVQVRMYCGREMAKSSDGYHTFRMPAASFFLDEKDRLVGNRWDQIELKLSDSQLNDAIANGLTLNFNFRIPRDLKRGFIKLIIYDSMNDRLASCSEEFSLQLDG